MSKLLNRLIQEQEYEKRRLERDEGIGLTSNQLITGVRNFDATGVSAMTSLVNAYKTNPSEETYTKIKSDIENIRFIDNRQETIKSSVLENLNQLNNINKAKNDFTKEFLKIENENTQEGLAGLADNIYGYIGSTNELRLEQIDKIQKALLNKARENESVYDNTTIPTLFQKHTQDDGMINTITLLEDLNKMVLTNKNVGSEDNPIVIRDLSMDDRSSFMTMAQEANESLREAMQARSEQQFEEQQKAINKELKMTHRRVTESMRIGNDILNAVQPEIVKNSEYGSYDQVVTNIAPFLDGIPKPGEKDYDIVDYQSKYVEGVKAIDAFAKMIIQNRIRNQANTKNLEGFYAVEDKVDELTTINDRRHVQTVEELIGLIDAVLEPVEDKDANTAYKHIFDQMVNIVHDLQDISFGDNADSYINAPWDNSSINMIPVDRKQRQISLMNMSKPKLGRSYNLLENQLRGNIGVTK